MRGKQTTLPFQVAEYAEEMIGYYTEAMATYKITIKEAIQKLDKSMARPIRSKLEKQWFWIFSMIGLFFSIILLTKNSLCSSIAKYKKLSSESIRNQSKTSKNISIWLTSLFGAFLFEESSDSIDSKHISKIVSANFNLPPSMSKKLENINRLTDLVKVKSFLLQKFVKLISGDGHTIWVTGLERTISHDLKKGAALSFKVNSIEEEFLGMLEEALWISMMKKDVLSLHEQKKLSKTSSNSVLMSESIDLSCSS